jgi:PKD repeat protein
MSNIFVINTIFDNNYWFTKPRGSWQKRIMFLVLIGTVMLWVFPVLAEQTATPLWIYTTGMNVPSVAVSADGTYIAAAGSGDTGKVSYFNREGQYPWYNNTEGAITSVAMSADGQYVAAESVRGMLYYFSQDGTPLWSNDTGYNGQYVAVSADGEYIAATGVYGWQGKVSYFAKNGTLLWSHNTDTNTGIRSVGVSADGGNVAVGSGADSSSNQGGKVYYYTRDGTLLWSYNTIRDALVAVSADGNVAVGSVNGKVYYFSRDGRLFWSNYTGDSVISVTVSADGRYIAAGSKDQTYFFSDNGTLLWNYTSGDYHPSIVVSSNGRFVAAGGGSGNWANKVYYLSQDGTLLWSYTTEGQLFSVAVSSDGKYVAAGSSLVYYFPGVSAPHANFMGTPTSGTAPLTVQFNDTSTNFPTCWNWSFGDTTWFNTTSSSQRNTSHSYSNAGTYSVTLMVNNTMGSDTKTNADYITVSASPPPPVAAFSGIPTSGTAPLTVQFTDESTNTPTGWAWFFGDENFTAPWALMNASAGWSGRSRYSSVVMPDGSIVLMGGSHKNDTWRSTDGGATWIMMNKSAGWLARRGHSSVVMPDGSIVLMGGHDGSDYKNDTWRSTDGGTTWIMMNKSSGWSARWQLTSVVMPDGIIVLMGGVDDSLSARNDVWRSTDNGATWTPVNAGTRWPTRCEQSIVVMPDGSIVLMGGSEGSILCGGVFFNDVWRSTDKGATWTEVNASAGWARRHSHSSVAMPDGSIVLMGGSDGSDYKNDVWRSTDNGAMWTEVNASAGWARRYGHSSVAMPDGSIILMGGSDGSDYKNDVWRFMPAGSSAQNPSHTYTSPGIYNVSLQAYNTAGYNSTRKVSYITVLRPAPTVTGISPMSGPTSGGTWVNVTGTGFIGATVVKFGTTAGTYLTVNSSTKITVRSPANAAGVVDITVTTPGGTSSTSAADGFTYVAPPTITSITPNSGPTTGNTLITIRGTNFVSGGLFGVKVGGWNATSVSWVNATTITAKTTIGSAGVRTVVVINNDGQTATKASGFTYIAPPTISSITPNSGPIKEKIPITIRGTNFVSGGSFGLKIGGVAATNVVRINTTTITAKTPEGTAGAKTVVVTNNDGQIATKIGGFTYVARLTPYIDPPITPVVPPTILSITSIRP